MDWRRLLLLALPRGQVKLPAIRVRIVTPSSPHLPNEHQQNINCQLSYHCIPESGRQLPTTTATHPHCRQSLNSRRIELPRNSRRMELSGTRSLFIGRNHSRKASRRLASIYPGLPNGTWRSSGSTSGFSADTLVDQGGVEHHIRVFLVREDIALFTAPHRLPALDGNKRRVAALAGIAHDAPDQAGIGGRDAVVPVQVELGQGGDIRCGKPSQGVDRG